MRCPEAPVKVTVTVVPSGAAKVATWLLSGSVLPLTEIPLAVAGRSTAPETTPVFGSRCANAAPFAARNSGDSQPTCAVAVATVVTTTQRPPSWTPSKLASGRCARPVATSIPSPVPTTRSVARSTMLLTDSGTPRAEPGTGTIGTTLPLSNPVASLILPAVLLPACSANAACTTSPAPPSVATLAAATTAARIPRGPLLLRVSFTCPPPIVGMIYW